MKRLLVKFVLAAAILVPAYYLLVMHSPKPAQEFRLDLAQLRLLANSLPGDGPSEVRFEKVMALSFTESMIMAGASWKKSLMPVYSYQVVYPDKTLIIDTALDRNTTQPDFLVDSFDEAAYARMNAAMERASQIVITHEHMDHIGGLATHPKLADLLPAVKLTAEQLANPKGMEPAVLPAETMKGYAPLQYEDMLAIAPGVVLVKSPGHTPGSQMVYVQTADGRERLFLGDVSWRLRNVELVRERPLFMTLMIGENRQQVLAQFAALRELQQDNPAFALVPGHDGPVMDALVRSGMLAPGFR